MALHHSLFLLGPVRRKCPCPKPLAQADLSVRFDKARLDAPLTVATKFASDGAMTDSKLKQSSRGADDTSVR